LHALNAPPVRYAVLTHWHWDHVFGTSAFNAPAVGQRETYLRVAHLATLDWSDIALESRLASGQEIAFVSDHLKQEMTPSERGKVNIIPPEIIFDDTLELNPGGITCRVIHVGGDHSSDSSVVHVPSEGVVFLGDCLYSGFSRSGTFYTAEKLFPLLDKLLALQADYYYYAHSVSPMTRVEFFSEASKLKTIGEAALASHGDRHAAISILGHRLDEPLTGAHLDILDEFLNPGIDPY
jgi:glyoxylase-like metal-dependent hydrolase (beta-lactamase superfamily II)